METRFDMTNGAAQIAVLKFGDAICRRATHTAARSRNIFIRRGLRGGLERRDAAFSFHPTEPEHATPNSFPTKRHAARHDRIATSVYGLSHQHVWFRNETSRHVTRLFRSERKIQNLRLSPLLLRRWR